MPTRNSNAAALCGSVFAGVAFLAWLAPLQSRAAEIVRAETGRDPVPGAYFLDADVLIDARPAAVRHVINHACELREHYPHIAYCRSFRVEGNRSWSYSVIAAPVVDPRDYTIVTTLESELAPDGSGTFRTVWTLDDAAGPAPRPGIVRLPFNRGAITITPVDGGRRSLMRYEIRTNPGGAVPSWVAGHVTRRTLPESMNTVERLAQQEDAANRVILPDAKRMWAGCVVKPLDHPLPTSIRRASLLP